MKKIKTKNWDKVNRTIKVYKSKKLEQLIVSNHIKMCKDMDAVRTMNPLNL